ncbi:MAG: ABC transporter ATP-binding protein [Woeseiaceae bacterium]|nr:ABC transporter ATP-binding protein [Woeseiaceae bacterium]
MNTSAVLHAQGVEKTFGTTRAVAGVDLSIQKGEVCALLGENGAGKTTFIQCALGLTRPTAGRVQVLGQPAGSRSARGAIGAMLQDSDLPELMTAREHLSLFATYYSRPADIATLIGDTGIEAFADTRYKKLSGGQKRRVQFALALVGNPDLLFLDEPTTGLDQAASRAVWNNVRAMVDRGKTILLTTHYLEEADALADRIVVMQKGGIVADGPTDDIRGRVGGALISCQTSLLQSQVISIPGVRSVQEKGRGLAIVSEDAALTLRHLLDRDRQLSDLTVQKPGLSEAIDSLTDTTTQEAA